jgi:hypothetical protein
MGFHRRHISNEQVIRLFNEGGAERVFDWYTRGVDALVTEIGLSSTISSIINDAEWQTWGKYEILDEITDKIYKEIGIEDIEK